MINKRALFFQAIRGPVLLITIGTLFAIHQTGHISFGRTWPVLIIVIGLIKLFERAAGPVTPFAPPGAYQQPPASGAYQPPSPGSYQPPPPGGMSYPGGGAQ